jgi:hypothetical protein
MCSLCSRDGVEGERLAGALHGLAALQGRFLRIGIPPAASMAASSALVASSRMRIGGSFRSARDREALAFEAALADRRPEP